MAAIAAVLVSCGGDGARRGDEPSLVTAPSIEAFTASTNFLAPGGGTVALSWVASGATQLSIDGGIGSVVGLTAVDVVVVQTTTFTLTATNAQGAAQRSVTVEVGVAVALPVIAAFTATPAELPVGGGTTTLTWNVTGATTLVLDNGVGDVSGTVDIAVPVAASATFTLTATNSAGSTTAHVTVSVPTGPPTVNAFTVTPNGTLPASGGTVTFDYDVTGATQLTIAPDVGDVTNVPSPTVLVSETTTFTLTASNANGTATAEVTVTVHVPSGPPSILTFSATPSSLPVGGGGARLRWTQLDAASLTIDNGVGNVTHLGYVDVQVTTTTTFKLTASNSHGSAQAQLDITVTNPPTTVITSFTATPSTLTGAGYVTLAWTASNYELLHIDNGVGFVTFAPGSTQVWVTNTTTFTLTAVGQSSPHASTTVFVTQ